MIPSEKAKELFNKFGSFNTYGLDKMCCKNSAIYLCNEIIESNPMSPYNGDYYELVDDRISAVKEYWQQVKEEINKI